MGAIKDDGVDNVIDVSVTPLPSIYSDPAIPVIGNAAWRTPVANMTETRQWQDLANRMERIERARMVG